MMGNQGRLIITGASGWLASEIAIQAKTRGIVTVGVSSHEFSSQMFEEVVTNKQFLSSFELIRRDVIIHCAFCRKSIPSLLCESLRWSSQVFAKAARSSVYRIINVSSQAVYDSNGTGCACETDELCPTYPYAFAKASSEYILNTAVASSGSDSSYVNARLASVMGVSNNCCSSGVLRVFIEKALRGEDLSIAGGQQVFSFISIHDAADALLHLASLDVSELPNSCNVGLDKKTPMLDMAHCVVSLVSDFVGAKPVNIALHEGSEKDNMIKAGMNCSRIASLEWKPSFSFEDIVEEMIEYLSK